MKKILFFVRDFIIMLAIILLVEFVFYKFNWLKEIDISYTVGFMIGWSIWQGIDALIKNKKNK